jgi:hypothetical protein
MAEIAQRAQVESWREPEGMRRLAVALGAIEIRDVTRLGGGMECATHAFSVAGRRLVLKRSRADARGVPQEFANLGLASRLAVPTPEPVALDADGELVRHTRAGDDGGARRTPSAPSGPEPLGHRTCRCALGRPRRLGRRRGSPPAAVGELATVDR